MNTIIEKIRPHLIKAGWKDHQQDADTLMFYRGFPGYPECACNQHKAKQAEITFTTIPTMDYMGCTVTCTGETKDGFWVQTEIYGFEVGIENIEKALEKALAQWKHAAI